MYKCMIVVAFVATAAFYFTGVQGQSDAGPATGGIPTQCLGCLCEAVSGCNTTKGCAGDICGLFHITWGYWADAGKPTQAGESVESPTAFSNCVTEPFCAARTVQGYMAKFQQDCNLDGKINCLDYAYIHKLGGYGCRGTLPEPYQTKLFQCLKAVNFEV